MGSFESSLVSGLLPRVTAVCCGQVANHTPDARGQVCTTQNTTMALVRRKCVGQKSCTFTHADTQSFGDPCVPVHDIVLAIRSVLSFRLPLTAKRTVVG